MKKIFILIVSCGFLIACDTHNTKNEAILLLKYDSLLLVNQKLTTELADIKSQDSLNAVHAAQMRMETEAKVKAIRDSVQNAK